MSAMVEAASSATEIVLLCGARSDVHPGTYASAILNQPIFGMSLTEMMAYADVREVRLQDRYEWDGRLRCPGARIRYRRLRQEGSRMYYQACAVEYCRHCAEGEQ